MPTIYEIAQELDVNISTVSRALAGKPGVSEQTRNRVLDLARRRGYQPSDAARSLSTGRSYCAALLTQTAPPAADSTMAWLPSLESRLQDQGYSLRLGMLDCDADSSYLRPNQADAAVILCNDAACCLRASDLLAARRMAAVFIDPPAAVKAARVIYDREGAVRQQCSALIQSGRRRIGLIAPGDPAAAAEFAGYRHALDAAGITPDTALQHTVAPQRSPDGYDAGRSGAEALLAGNCDAIICADDWLAYGALAAIDASGRRVPVDIAVSGMGDLPYSAITPVPLSSWRFDVEATGSAIADLLIAAINGDHGAGDAARFIGGVPVPRASTAR